MHRDTVKVRSGHYREEQVLYARVVLDDARRHDIAAASAHTPRLWSPYEREEPLLVPGQSDPFTCLNEVDLFSDLTAEDIRAMDLMIPAAHVRRGELLFSQAEPVDALFILKSGRVRIFRVTEEGKAITMAILGLGAVFGEMLQLGQRMYDNYAEAIEDSTVCRLSSVDVERFLLTDPRIAIRVAGLLGATREATSKVMVELAAQGFIRQARGRVTILNEDGLHQIARRNS